MFKPFGQHLFIKFIVCIKYKFEKITLFIFYSGTQLQTHFYLMQLFKISTSLFVQTFYNIYTTHFPIHISMDTVLHFGIDQ